MKKLVAISLSLGLVTGVFSLPIMAQGDAKLAAKADPAKGRELAATTCAGCHGADGNSPSPAFPSLAGQHASYIAAQLANFKSGERKNPIMAGIAASLSPEDMRSLGAHFASQSPKANAATTDKVLAEQGKRIYRGGVFSTGVPACAGCHGPEGAGVAAAQMARLASQHADYTLIQLKNFRSGERLNPMMQSIAGRLSDQEMKAVAEYVTGLH